MSPRRVTVIVGYREYYAVWVHENLNIDHSRHSCGGRAKYLEEPVRGIRKEFPRAVANHMRRGLSLLQALLNVGRMLMYMSQKIVPVDTGALRASAVTRREM